MDAILDDLIAALPPEEGKAVAEAVAKSEKSRRQLVDHSTAASSFLFNGSLVESSASAEQLEPEVDANVNRNLVSKIDSGVTCKDKNFTASSGFNAQEAVRVSLPSFDSFINSAGPRPGELANANSTLKRLRGERRNLRHQGNSTPNLGSVSSIKSSASESFSQKKLQEAMAYASRFASPAEVNSEALMRSGGPVTQQPHGIVRRQSQRKVQNSRVSSKTRQTYGVSKKKTKAASRSGARRRGHSSSKQNIGRNQALLEVLERPCNKAKGIFGR